MKNSILYITAAALLLAPSCQRELDLENTLPDNALIARIVDGSAETRTSYDGTYSNNNFVWTSGDEIAIHLSNGKYDVLTITPIGDGKKGSILSSTKNSAMRDTYAVYPASARDDDHYGQTGDVLNLIYTDEYDIIGKLASDYVQVPLVAENTSRAATADDADLEFYHVGGLLRINLAAVNANTQKIKVTLDKDVTGTFPVTFDTDGIPSVTTTGKTTRNVVTFTVAESTLGAAAAVVLNIPVPCSTYESAVVEMLGADGAVLDTKTFNRTMVFDRHHGKQLGMQEYSLSFDGTSVADIAYSGRDVLTDQTKNVTVTVTKTDGTTQSAAPWKAYFSSSEVTVGTMVSSLSGLSDSPLPDSNGESWMTLSAYEGDGNANSVTVNVNATQLKPRRIYGAGAQAMVNYWQTSTPVEWVDLSTYDIITGAETESIETANCYVIKDHGSYLIPCVYGNSMQGSMGKNSTFATTATSTEYPVLANFINADGKAIKNAVIPRDQNLSISDNLVPRVVWQDTYPGCEILTDDDLKYISTNGTAGNCPYIIVDFKKEKIAPGNIVVALFDAGNDKILWSWHLWVTRETLSTVQVKEYDGSINQVLNVNLGWTPPISYEHVPTDARDQHVVIVSIADGKVVDCFKVSQASFYEEELDADIMNCTAYSNTFYQFGRKDPMPPTNGSNLNRPVSYGEGFDCSGASHSEVALFSFASTVSATARLSEMIKHPGKFNGGYGEEPFYINLWDVNRNTMYDSTNTETTFDDTVSKSIYDPSPRGFTVPPMNACTGFTSTGDTTSGTTALNYGTYVAANGEMPAGWKMSTAHSATASTHTIFFPFTGYRYPYVSGSNKPSMVIYVNTNGFYWSAGVIKGEPLQNAYGMAISSTYISPINSNYRTDGRSIRPIVGN